MEFSLASQLFLLLLLELGIHFCSSARLVAVHDSLLIALLGSAFNKRIEEIKGRDGLFGSWGLECHDSASSTYRKCGIFFRRLSLFVRMLLLIFMLNLLSSFLMLFIIKTNLLLMDHPVADGFLILCVPRTLAYENLRSLEDY